ncbi:MAG: FAD-dependent thymidylate synthase [Lutibacter sp.]|jgi:thymidylate synthase (FAD)
MKIIKPSFEILSKIDGIDMLKSIERAGRTCYKSEDKITEESSHSFIKMLLDKGHESVLEHEKISILFVCDRGVSHEIVRHRIASFSQESTRYCNYSKDKFDNQITFIQPLWITDEQIELVQKMNERNFSQIHTCTLHWYQTMNNCQNNYNFLIKQGWKPQEARSVLPNSLKTEIVVTANLREWRTIFKQRTSSAAHPQMRELMCPLLDELKTICPVVFDDINY